MNEQKKQWLLQRDKELRRKQTPQETELWGIIRAKRFEGLKFYRQYMIGSSIVDFCCPEKMLVVELDGLRNHHGSCEDPSPWPSPHSGVRGTKNIL